MPNSTKTSDFLQELILVIFFFFKLKCFLYMNRAVKHSGGCLNIMCTHLKLQKEILAPVCYCKSELMLAVYKREWTSQGYFHI